MLPFVVSCRLAQLSFVLILTIEYFLLLAYLSKDRFLVCEAKFFSAGKSAAMHFIHFCNAKRCRPHKRVKKLLGKNLKHILNRF